MSEEKAEESKEERRMVAIAIRPCEGVDAAALYTKIKAEIKSQVSLAHIVWSFIVAMWLACTGLWFPEQWCFTSYTECGISLPCYLSVACEDKMYVPPTC